MTIKVIVFGHLQDLLKTNEMSISEVKNTEDLITKLRLQFPDLSAANYVIALNKKIIQQSTELHDSDTIALMPPFSGG